MIKARANIETAKKTYKPGEIIKESLNDSDLEFLNKYKFIEVYEEKDSCTDYSPSYEFGIDHNVETLMESNDKDTSYKDETALKKMSKDEIVSYAAGFNLVLDESALKNDLIDSVLNYIEEQIAEQAV